MERDDFDDLLDEAERDFFPIKNALPSTQDVKKPQPQINSIDKMLDELLNEEGELVEETRPKQQPQQSNNPCPLINAAVTNPIGKCFPVILSGTVVPMGLNTRSDQKSCDRMRCMSCDFHVMWFDNYSWSDSCDYYFLRNNVPDFSRLKRKLDISQG